MKSNEISKLARQPDGVWAIHAPDEIDGFRPSRFYSAVVNSAVTMNPEQELIGLADDFSDLLQLSPQRANFLRPFEWLPDISVLEIGCGAGLTTSFLSSKNLKVDALESDRSLAQLAALRTRAADSTRIISEPFATLDFESNCYDVIILHAGSALHNSVAGHDTILTADAAGQVLSECRALLNDRGKFMLAVDNCYGINYLIHAADPLRYHPYKSLRHNDFECLTRFTTRGQWYELLTDSFNHVEEYFLFPDIYFSRVVLSHDFVEANPFAFQHLDAFQSNASAQAGNPAIDEIQLYQIANKNGYLGELANGYLYVMSDETSSHTGSIDFAHLPDFSRRPEFVSVIRKITGNGKINRLKVTDASQSPNTEIQQSFDSETYYTGLQLAILWRESLQIDPKGLKFEQYLLDYFDFLKKLDSGVIPGMNIDAIANNIIVDADNEYHLIDHEWQVADIKIKSDFVFYRAMVHFALRNAPIFRDFRWINGLVSLGDFVTHCFNRIGIDIGIGELQPFCKMDCRFQSQVMVNSRGYQLSDPFGVQLETGSAVTFVHWRFKDDHYHAHQKVLRNANTGNEPQVLAFDLPEDSRQVECFRFFPFEHLQAQGADYFSIESLRVCKINAQGIDDELMHLKNSDAVSRANIHRGIFYASKGDNHVFMFNNNDTFLEFKLPVYDPGDITRIRIEIIFRLAASHDYEVARYKYAMAEKKIETILQTKNFEIESLKKDLEEVSQEYDELKSSRIWRLLVAYRDTFRISGYPRKNFIGKLRHMIRLFNDSK